MMNLKSATCCDQCGTQLRSWDFQYGRAARLGTQVYCAPCRPTPVAPIPPLPEPGRETRWRFRRSRQIF